MTRPLTIPASSDARASSTARRAIANRLALVVSAAFLALFLVLGLRLIDVGATDFGRAGLFSTDEKMLGQLVRTMVRQGNLGLSHFYSYGPLYLYAARALLVPYGATRAVSAEAILVSLRLVSLFAGAGCICLTYLLGRRLWNSWTGALAAAMVALSATELAWSTTAHPDTLQVFWLLLGLILAAQLSERPSRSRLLLGAVCAGLAFATKYSGELLLPVLWLADLLSRAVTPAAGALARWRPAVSFLVDVIVSLSAFVASFLLVDPSVIREPRSFVYQMTLEAGLAHRGHLLVTQADPGGWIRVLAGSDLMGITGVALALAGLAAWIAMDLGSMARGAKNPAVRGRLVLAAWTAGYLIFVMVWVADLQPRYLLPALPGLSLMAAGLLTCTAYRSVTFLAAAAILALVMLVPLGDRLQSYARAEAARMQRPGVSERLEAGRWLAGSTAGDSAVLTDAYAYIPDSFINVDETFGLSHAQIAAGRPGIIITDTAIRNRFLDPSVAARYADGAEAYQEIAATYAELEAGRIPCYSALQRFGPVTIYGRTPAPGAGGGC